MKVFAQTLNLKEDTLLIEKYKEYHKNVWPEILDSLKKVGITDMKIFLHGRRLFMYMETTDAFVPEIDFPRYLEQDPKCQEWEDLMNQFQEPVPDAAPGEKWSMMEQVFQY